MYASVYFNSARWNLYYVFIIHYYYFISFTNIYLQHMSLFNFPCHFPYDIFLKTCAIPTCCEQWKCDVEAFLRGLITKAEFKNSSSTEVSWWNGKQRCAHCNFLVLFIFFLVKWDFLWNPFATQTSWSIYFYPPTTSDWRFAWQNGYERRP